MPDLVEQMYCSQQIFIPPNLPSILKKYAKAAIRTQPGDLLIWSSAYFRALAAGIPPPTKERIEYPPVNTPSGLSPGFLKVLISQIGKGETVSKEILEERWRGVCLSVQALQDLLAVGMFGDDVHWLEFLAICAGTLQPSLTKTMMQLCELLTEEPEGGSAAIPVSTFLNLYKYLAKLDCGPVNTLEQYEKTLKEDSETQCAAEVLEPHEEEVETGVPNIDWDTAIDDGSTAAGDDNTQAGVEHTENTDNADETDNPEAEAETPSKDVEDDTETVDAEEGAVAGDGEEIVTEETNQELKSEAVTDEVAGATEGTDNEGNELSGSGGDVIEATTGETEKPAEEGLDETKDEPLVNDAEEDAGDGGSEEGSNECDSGVATADESLDPKGAVKDDVEGNGGNDELTDVPPNTEKDDESSNNTEKDEGSSNHTGADQITPEQQVVEAVDKITTDDVGAVPAERTDSKGENDGDNNGTAELVEGDERSSEKPSDTDDADQPEDSPNEPLREVPGDTAEESIIAENQGEAPGETNGPETDDTGEVAHTDSANDNNETTEGLSVAQSEDETNPLAVDEVDSTVEPKDESAIESNDDVPNGATEDEPVATNINDEAVPDEGKADESNPKEPQTTEPMLNLGPVYIIDDDGTLSAAPGTVSANDDGDLQERDSDKSVATNPSDDGMMVWPEIKPEKEEVEAEPQMEKEVTSEDGIEVFTDVDIQATQEEIKMLPEKSEDNQPEQQAAANEENIFAPQIDSFTDLLEAESGPTEEFSPEELAAAEGSSEYIGDEGSRKVLEPAASVHLSEVPTGNVTQSTEHTQLETLEEVKAKSDPKYKKGADIESLVKKDSEMMLLPTPVTSDIMLYVENECEKSTQKVSPTQQLSNKMSLVDVQVAVPIDETVVEVVERHRYPKWMNIPGIGPIVPDHIVEEAEKYFLKVSELQEGMVMPRNIKHFHCPPLEMNPECVEDDRKWSITSRSQ